MEVVILVTGFSLECCHWLLRGWHSALDRASHAATRLRLSHWRSALRRQQFVCIDQWVSGGYNRLILRVRQALHHRCGQLFTLSEGLLKNDRCPFALRRFIQTEHVGFSHEVRQLVVQSLFTCRNLELAGLILYCPRDAEGEKCVSNGRGLLRTSNHHTIPSEVSLAPRMCRGRHLWLILSIATIEWDRLLPHLLVSIAAYRLSHCVSLRHSLWVQIEPSGKGHLIKLIVKIRLHSHHLAHLSHDAELIKFSRLL